MAIKVEIVKPTEAVPACKYCGSTAVVKFGTYNGIRLQAVSQSGGG